MLTCEAPSLHVAGSLHASACAMLPPRTPHCQAATPGTRGPSAHAYRCMQRSAHTRHHAHSSLLLSSRLSDQEAPCQVAVLAMCLPCAHTWPRQYQATILTSALSSCALRLDTAGMESMWARLSAIIVFGCPYTAHCTPSTTTSAPPAKGLYSAGHAGFHGMAWSRALPLPPLTRARAQKRPASPRQQCQCHRQAASLSLPPQSRCPLPARRTALPSWHGMCSAPGQRSPTAACTDQPISP